MPKKQILTILILASCYLIISIPFVYSYVVGDSLAYGKRIRMSIFEPSLHIIDDLRPVDCETPGYVSFRMFIDNLPPGSNMTGMEAYVTDLSYTSARLGDPQFVISRFPNIVSAQKPALDLKIYSAALTGLAETDKILVEKESRFLVETRVSTSN